MRKTQKVMMGVTTTALALGLTGCGSSNAERPSQPTDQNCRDWDWDDDEGVYVCDDSNSTYHGHYFYGGRYYKDKNSLLNSSDDKSYKNSSSSKGESQTSSGFGSGSKSYGG